MAIEILNNLKILTFSRLEAHSDRFPQDTVTRNLMRASIWGTLSSGATAVTSFIFSRFLVQEGAWKALAPHIFKASLTSCGMFAAVAAYGIYKSIKSRADDSALAKLNERVSLVTKSCALVGFIGAAAAWASKFAPSNIHVSLLTKHSLSPLLGLGTAGSILWIFLISQNQQPAKTNEGKYV